MNATVVRTIATRDPNKRVVIVQRDDGLFSFAVESYRGRTLRPRPKGLKQFAWSRGKLDPNIYETADVAERAASARFGDLSA